MADQIYVKPGMLGDTFATVRHPSYAGGAKPIPPEGAFVALDTISRKRIKEGGLIRAQPPHVESESAPVAPAPAPVAEEPKPALAVRKAKGGDRPADGTGE